MSVFQISENDPPIARSPEWEAARAQIEGLQRIGDDIAALLGELTPEYGYLRGDSHTLGFLRTSKHQWTGLSEREPQSLELALAKLAAPGASALLPPINHAD